MQGFRKLAIKCELIMVSVCGFQEKTLKGLIYKSCSITFLCFTSSFEQEREQSKKKKEAVFPKCSTLFNADFGLYWLRDSKKCRAKVVGCSFTNNLCATGSKSDNKCLQYAPRRAALSGEHLRLAHGPGRRSRLKPISTSNPYFNTTLSGSLFLCLGPKKLF
ncbi:Protein pelota-like protein, partial [Frankliniella fusca]